ncbi:Rne/Rng family ribonuclease [Thermostaphylospora chromogena]|uniref:Ribonuclease E n=1 Tax=Thermostaphylospora chromogena TaxID=35622 RepID=A0A1H1I5H4_9ACTN|nr:Rne/Rng family ribonuclease [Thermostaphylospora chromogena]SDR32809.1 ribonuclease E [Thermostaphylospora chromogena]
MLDNEPIAGADGLSGDTTEKKKPTRRRAASRPAGPPPEEAERAAGLFSDGPTRPLTRPAGTAMLAVVPETPRVTAQVDTGPKDTAAIDTGEDGPGEAEKAETAPDETGKTDNKPEKAETARDAADTADADAAPERPTRRRSASTGTARRGRTSKKAAEEDAEAATDTGEQAAEQVEKPPTRRRRATRKKAEEGERSAEATAETAAPRSAPAADAESGADTAEQAAPEEPAAEEGVGTASEPADGTEEAAEDASQGDETADAEAEESGEDAAIAEALPEDEPLDDEPAGEDLDEGQPFALQTPENRTRLLADPFGLAAQNQMRTAPPTLTFQAPPTVLTPLFQAPDPLLAEQVRRVTEPAADDGEPDEPLEDVDDASGEPYADSETGEGTGGGRRRRRRRGGRGRGRSRDREESGEEAEAETETEAETEPETPAEPKPDADADAEQEPAPVTTTVTSSSRRRRRRRRRSGEDVSLEPSADDPPNTVVRIRAPRAGRGGATTTSVDEVQSVRGSTRLEAKKQRRREGRELGRRRPPIITESEFLARRESVERVMVVRKQGGRTQIAVLEDGILVEHYVDRESGQSYVGNVYLGKVQNVLPSMEAAFVDIGKGRNAVLYAGEVNFDTAGLEGQPKRIESALKSGQSVLVQVTKDPIGHKGARLTSQISLPGRYLVYVPDGSMTGISRKLPDKERARLKSILKKVMPENAGVIVRTAAEGASEEELSRDVARLSAQWEDIQRKAKSASPPELLYAEPDLTIRVVRDVFNEDFSSLVVAGDEMWDTVSEYVNYVAPHLADRLSRWEEDGDVFAAYRIDEQIAKALERKVWLPSGGSLVIDRTEAMTVIDVNTGKFTGQGGNLEETVTRNNLEAAEEIVRQLRLRDIGGIIVIDFIDMVLESNRDLVLRRLLECLSRDRTKHQVAEVTSLGLVQMTRKRVGQGLLEAFSTQCECCNGRGLHISTEPVPGKPEPRGTQGKMAIEKAVAEKLAKNGDASAAAAGDRAGRDSVTGALNGVPDEEDQDAQTSGRGRRRSRRAKSAAD